MNNKIYPILIILFLTNCKSEMHLTYKCIKEKYRGNFDNNVIDTTKLLYEGYYKGEYIRKNENTFEEGFLEYIFFKNGLYASQFNFEKDVFVSYIWGTYEFNNDTIILKGTSPGSIVTPYSTELVVFAIINRNQLKLVIRTEWCEGSWKDKGNFNPFYYNETIPIPSSKNCWLLEKKWFWKQEAEWKRYMDSVKPKKYRK